MSSPLDNAIKKILDKDYSSFHTPGHKGVGRLALKCDLTELEGIESLYESAGAIKESEEGFSKLYGCNTVLSAGGSTLCIQTMLAMSVPFGGRVISNRGLHISAVNAMGLLDIDPFWIYSTINQQTGLMKPVTPIQIENAIKVCPEAKAVYLTSPDYYGQNCDILSISKICKKHNVKLMVDGAHGAHYKFLNPSKYPIDLGADLSCASLHKTLPAMTGAAILSMSEEYSAEQAKKYMRIFGSTSPSYAVLLSADKLLTLLGSDVGKKLEYVIKKVKYTKSILTEAGFKLIDRDVDPARLAFRFIDLGYDKKSFLLVLNQYKIAAEYIDNSYCVLIPTIANSKKDWDRLEQFITQIPKQEGLEVITDCYVKLEKAVSIREAIFGLSHSVELVHAEGKVVSTILTPCPPGVPLAMPGERLNRASIDLLKKYGIFKIDVL